MRIEPVTEQTLAYVTQLGKEMVELSQFGITGPDFDWNHSLAQTRWCLAQDNYYIRMASDDLNKPLGFVAGHVVQFHFSPLWMGMEDAWFVREDTVDRAKVGMALMRGFVRWALDDKKAVMVQSGDIAGINSEAVWALYKHMGFRRFGSIYKYSRGSM